MAALTQTLNLPNHFLRAGSGGPISRPTLGVQSVESSFENVLNFVSSTSEAYLKPNDIIKLRLVRRALKSSKGYASLAFIVRNSRLGVSETKRLLEASADFKKSKIRASNGDPVYYLATSFSTAYDYWNLFKHLCYLKY